MGQYQFIASSVQVLVLYSLVQVLDSESWHEWQVLQKVEAYKKWGDVDQLPAVAAVASSAASSNSSSSPSSSTSTPASSPSSGVAVAPAAAVATAAPVVRVNPNNPAEYCSTIPPALQAAAAALPPPSVLVPVGVLKKEGSSSQSRSRSDPPKQVLFHHFSIHYRAFTKLKVWTL